MKKILSIIILLSAICQLSYALEPKRNVIYKTLDGTQIKCTGKRVSGLLKEYDSVTDYYTFKDDTIYSKNLINMYGNPKSKARKVKNVMTWCDNISFTDKLGKNSKEVSINKFNGEYTFSAIQKNRLKWYFPKAEVVGKCEIIK